MATYRGKKFTKQELMRYTGNMNKIAGIRTFRVDGGKADAIRMHDVKSGDLAFTVMESRCMDIEDFRYKGVSLNLLSKCGPVNAGLAEKEEMNFLRSITGGMLYTCGVSNVGTPYRRPDGEEHFHGRFRFEPATSVTASADWDGDEFRIALAGTMRETGLFASNIALRRRIDNTLGDNAIEIRDDFENESFVDNPFMLMYHVNCSYPVVQKGSKVYAPVTATELVNPQAQAEPDNWNFATDPVDGGIECVYVHDVLKDDKGLSYSCVWNAEEKLGIGVTFCADTLPKLLEWRCMASGDYVIGLQPTNCMASGRQVEIDRGTLRHIGPWEHKKTFVRIEVLDGEEAFAKFRGLIDSCKTLAR